MGFSWPHSGLAFCRARARDAVLASSRNRRTASMLGGQQFRTTIRCSAPRCVWRGLYTPAPSALDAQLPLTPARCRRLLTVSARADTSRGSSAGGPSGMGESNEQRLVGELRGLSQTGSVAQREAVWGLYRRIVSAGTAAHSMAPATILGLIELMAGDTDMVRALTRISEVLGEITAKRKLTDAEMATVRLIWEKAEEMRTETKPWTPFFRRHKEDSDLHGAEVTVLASIPKAPVEGGPRAEHGAAELPDLESAEHAVRKLRRLLYRSPIYADLPLLWQTYRAALQTRGDTAGEECLNKRDMRRLIDYCGNLGKMVSGRFLAQIEVDLATDPELYPNRHGTLIVTYSKLGLLEHSQRIFRDVSAEHGADNVPVYVEWCMCFALFRSMRHKEGRAIFDRLLETGKANSLMSSVLIMQYAYMRNRDRAMALFDDMCRRRVLVTRKALNLLAMVCAMDQDPVAAHANIVKLATHMRDWKRPPDSRFFISILHGYNSSQQDDMFDALAARLRARNIPLDISLNKIMMDNAARRNSTALAMELARKVAVLPKHIPHIVGVLCRLGRASSAEDMFPLSQYPENNTTVNIRLELAMHGSDVGSNPKALEERVLDMTAHGFVPSFRLAKRTIELIRLYGGSDMALESYDRLVAAGVPVSIQLLMLILDTCLSSRTPERAIGVYEQLRDIWLASDFGMLSMQSKTVRGLALLLIQKQGVDAAQAMFDVISTLPTPRQNLPFTPLIEYYVNHRVLNKAQVLINQIIRDKIGLDAHGINLCCRHIADCGGVTELTNFFRHLHRVHQLEWVADDVFESFFTQCVTDYIVANFEWAVTVLARMRTTEQTWKAIINRLGAGNVRILSRMVQLAIRAANKKTYMAALLLLAARGSPWRTLIADVVLDTLLHDGVAMTKQIHELALMHMIGTWQARRKLIQGQAGEHLSSDYLLRTLDKHITVMASSPVRKSLVTTALLILSSTSATAYRRCLDILDGIPLETRNVRFYGAIIKGCAYYGAATGVEEVRRRMNKDGVYPNRKILNHIMECYTRIQPPPSLNAAAKDEAVVLEESESESLDLSVPHEENEAERRFKEEVRSRAAQPIRLFYEEILRMVLTVWDEFSERGISTDHMTYAMLIQAFYKARKYSEGENVIRTMLESGIQHNESTAFMWIRFRMFRGDIDGALKVFGAISNAERCAKLVAEDSRFQGLDKVSLLPKHFALFVHHYAIAGEFDHSLAFLSAMHRLEFKIDPWLYANLLKQLAQADRRDLFVRVMKQMVASGAMLSNDVMSIVRDYSAYKQQANGASGSEHADDRVYEPTGDGEPDPQDRV
ncbi:hypothetical protein GGF46_002981 [Coemansia sp. RSA 552]|nr:hypothetical protein GGF46_002981 [Coemansia sp. RSA 552]